MTEKENIFKQPAWWRVLAAYSIDSVLLFVLIGMSLTGIAASLVTPDSEDPMAYLQYMDIFFYIICFGIPVLYFSVFERKWGKSIGKMLTHLRLEPHKPFFRKLVLSYSIDVVLIAVLITLISNVIYSLPIDEDGLIVEILGGNIGDCLLMVSIAAAYFTVLVYFAGCSLGQRVTGLTIVQEVK